MACLITSGFPLQCRDNSGGIQNVYIATFNGTSMGYTVGTGASASLITAFTGATVSAYTFNQPLETASFEQAGAFSTENGTSNYKATVMITLQKLNNTSTALINTLGQGVWRIIVLDQNGNYWLVGAQNGARVSAATPGTGKALGDLNGAVITFEATEPVSAYQVTTAAALSLITV
jgi:hypothetical protein